MLNKLISKRSFAVAFFLIAIVALLYFRPVELCISTTLLNYSYNLTKSHAILEAYSNDQRSASVNMTLGLNIDNKTTPACAKVQRTKYSDESNFNDKHRNTLKELSDDAKSARWGSGTA